GDDAAQTNVAVQIELPGQTNSPARRIRRSYRRRSNSTYGSDASSGGDTARPFAARSTNGVPRPDFSTFGIILQRNIFDPNRRPHRPYSEPTRVVRAEHITLVGTISYEKGTFAFFDGDDSEYQ